MCLRLRAIPQGTYLFVRDNFARCQASSASTLAVESAGLFGYMLHCIILGLPLKIYIFLVTVVCVCVVAIIAKQSRERERWSVMGNTFSLRVTLKDLKWSFLFIASPSYSALKISIANLLSIICPLCALTVYLAKGESLTHHHKSIPLPWELRERIQLALNIDSVISPASHAQSREAGITSHPLIGWHVMGWVFDQKIDLSELIFSDIVRPLSMGTDATILIEVSALQDNLSFFCLSLLLLYFI